MLTGVATRPTEAETSGDILAGAALGQSSHWTGAIQTSDAGCAHQRPSQLAPDHPAWCSHLLRRCCIQSRQQAQASYRCRQQAVLPHRNARPLAWSACRAGERGAEHVCLVGQQLVEWQGRRAAPAWQGAELSDHVHASQPKSQASSGGFSSQRTAHLNLLHCTEQQRRRRRRRAAGQMPARGALMHQTATTHPTLSVQAARVRLQRMGAQCGAPPAGVGR